MPTATKHKPYGSYEKYVKRPLDVILSGVALVVLSPVMGVTALLVRNKLGSPVLFTQDRPGKDEKIFKMYKFRSMTDERDAEGKLLPDDVRLTKFGKLLRSTSLDELPELWNILKGDMSIVGPRPQLVRDVVFMSDEQRMRHSVKPGLSGLAQVMGRNAISWEDKLAWDLKYIERISFFGDVKIVFRTVASVLKQSGITDGETVTSLDYGDALLLAGKVDQEKYDALQDRAKLILADYEKRMS